VTGTLLVARTHLFTAFRERITLFWVLIFPIFIFTILTLIFGRIGQEGEINFSIGLVNFDTESTAAWEFGAMIEDLFEELGTPQIEGKEPLFTLFQPEGGEDLEAFVAREQEALRRGQRAAVIVIPAGFSRRIEQGFAPAGFSADSPTSTSEAPKGTLSINYSEGNPSSEIATGIIEQILAGVDREILKRTGRFNEEAAVPAETVWVGEASEIRYVDFLLPGVILMAFFTSCLFGIPGAILFSRDQKILRRYWVTPLSVPRYLAGLSIGHIVVGLIQCVLLILLGKYGFGASISFVALQPVAFLLLAQITFMAFGFLIASVARTANSGMAIANVLNMPMMFLSGLFFPVAGLPLFLKAIVYANPVSYLAEGLRTSLGVEAGIFSTPLVVGVPLAWIALSIGVASRKLRWDVER